MASTPAEVAQPTITPNTEPTLLKHELVELANKVLDAGTLRRLAYTAGMRQEETKLATARLQAKRWQEEAKWWREEHDRVHSEFCEFVNFVAGELKVTK